MHEASTLFPGGHKEMRATVQAMFPLLLFFQDLMFLVQGWEAVEAKTEAMDAFVNVANDMSELIRLRQQWRATDDNVRSARFFLK